MPTMREIAETVLHLEARKAVLLSVPAPIVAGIIFRRRRREHRPSALALVGLALGVFTMLEMVVLYLALHSHVL